MPKPIDPGFDMMSPAQQNDIKGEVEEALKLWYHTRQWKVEVHAVDQGLDCRCEPAIHSHPPEGLRCDRHHST